MQTARDVSNEFRDLTRPASQRSASATPLASRAVAADSGAACADEGFWIAVLPVKCAGASTELKALADGLSEEIVAGLSRFSYLRVITSGSTQHYADQSPDLRVVGKDLGARYVMSASLRQTGTEVGRRYNSSMLPQARNCGLKPISARLMPKWFSNFRTTSCLGSFQRSPMPTVFCPTQ
jgi:TolB-like protein